MDVPEQMHDALGRLNSFLAGYREEGEIDFETVMAASADAIIRELRAIRELLEGEEDRWQGATRDIARRSRDLEEVEHR